ncbi:MAG: TonB-dependent receptor [Burkholderiaceae bacterium]|nr:MAG: TonB-dependent receptor [Burkholderiaceae bacterium]
MRQARHWRVPILCAAILLQAAPSSAQTADEEDLAQAYGDKATISLATGSQQSLRRAPAIASVITAEDIAATGATDLDEALETVAGLHVSRTSQANLPIYTIRGIRDTITGPQVLMLVNGIPVTHTFAGNRGQIWGGLPLENVARIEVIRGPGSALYGADAFAGVINIITKTATDINGTQTGARLGSFDSRDAWMLHGGKLGMLDVAGYLRVGHTDGAKEIVSADGATPLGTSRAPGPLNNGHDAIDGTLDLSVDAWRLRFGYKKRDNVGTGAGVAQALDPAGQATSERFTSDLTWKKSLSPHWDVDLQTSYMYYTEGADLILFPAGTNLGGGAFTDGMIGNPYRWEKHYRFAASTFYTGFEQHRLRLGLGAVKDDLYKIRETKNFNPDFSPIGTGSFADVTDVSNTVPYARPQKRILHYVYAQDEWTFAKDWTLTAGIRHDHYSDFGNTTNPRLALVWEANYNLTAKLLYGSAFRAPTFNDQHVINNPVNIGNPNLKPEKMKTLEAALVWQATSQLQLSTNIFRYQLNDIIRLDSTNTYQNAGQQTGTGMEFEASWDVDRNLRLSGNYSYQRSIDQATQQDAGMAPHHRIYLRSDWRFAPGWLVDTQLNWVGDRKREPGDARPDLKGYTTVDLTLRTQNSSPVNFTFSIRNLFDADAREPSAGNPVSIPNDLPLPGRSAFFEAIWKL